MRETAFRTTTAAPNDRTTNTTEPTNPKPPTKAHYIATTRRHTATLARKRRNITLAPPAPTYRTTRQRPTRHAQTPGAEYAPSPPTGHAPTQTPNLPKNTRRIITHQRTRRTHMRRPTGTHQTRTSLLILEPGKQRRSIPSRSTQKQTHHEHDNTGRAAPPAKNRRHPSTPPGPGSPPARRRQRGYQSPPAPAPASLNKTVIASMRSRIRTQTHKRISWQTLGERRLQKIQVLSGRNHRE